MGFSARFTLLGQREHRALIILAEGRDGKPRADLDALMSKAESVERFFRKSFDYWLDKNSNNRRFHGWSGGQHGGRHKECFVFKHQHGSRHHRFYGYLAHPFGDRPDFLVCVIVQYEIKKNDDTKQSVLDRIVTIRQEHEHSLQAWCETVLRKERGTE